MALEPDDTVKKVMSAAVVTIGPERPVSDARELFASCEFHHLMVCEDAQLVGVLSTSDLVRAGIADVFPEDESEAVKARRASDTTKVRELMRTDPITVEPDSKISLAAAMFSEGTFRALPVVEGGRLVGVLTVTDLLRHLYE